jgi:predicted AlkP superfamily phosphohydrolase/phosphomutase
VHTTIRVNTILTDAKLLQWRKVGEQYKVDESKSQAFALASGGSAHVYVNLEGREWPGLVPQDEYAEVQDKIVQALVESQDEDGQALFARVHKREELSALYLDSPNAGDVFVQARPGYVLSDKVGFREVLAEGACCAAVGYAATSEEMHGFWIGAGDGLPSGQVIQPVSVLDLAPTIAKALNFEPAQGLNGQPISGLWP